MQKCEYLNKINTATINPAKNNTIIVINIKYTVIYGKNNNQLLKLNDTMKELYVNFIDVFIFNIYEHLYLKNRNNKLLKTSQLKEEN